MLVEKALEYAIHNQRDRRKITDGDIIRLVGVLDKRRNRRKGKKDEHGKYQPKRSSDLIGSSRGKTAETVGTSETKVKRAREVIDHADEGTKQAARSGEKSVHRAYEETKIIKSHTDEIKQAKPVFNWTTETIE
jgi:hypothetical protein